MCDPFADFMSALEHCDTVTVSLEKYGDMSWDAGIIGKAIMHHTERQNTAASAWRTHEPPLEQAPETILAQTVLAGGDTAFVLLDTVGVEILGKQEWHLYEHNTDRRFYGKIVAWALIHPYEGVE